MKTPSEAEMEHWEEQFEEYYKSLPYEEQVETDAKNMTQAFKRRIKHRMREKINAL